MNWGKIGIWTSNLHLWLNPVGMLRGPLTSSKNAGFVRGQERGYSLVTFSRVDRALIQDVEDHQVKGPLVPDEGKGFKEISVTCHAPTMRLC